MNNKDRSLPPVVADSSKVEGRRAWRERCIAGLSLLVVACLGGGRDDGRGGGGVVVVDAFTISPESMAGLRVSHRPVAVISDQKNTLWTTCRSRRSRNWNERILVPSSLSLSGLFANLDGTMFDSRTALWDDEYEMEEESAFQSAKSVPSDKNSQSIESHPPDLSDKEPNTADRQQNEQSPRRLVVRRAAKNKRYPVVAVVGRPNVGKSSLVNRIAGSQRGGAIVADESGTTRDRTYRYAEFLGERFQVVDTGGLVFDDDERVLFAKEIRQQAMVAIEESSAVILVVDGQFGMTTMDLSIAEFLRRNVVREIPVFVAVNKCESETTGSISAASFWQLGLGEPVPVSALHGVGTAELLENVFDGIATRKTTAVPGFGTKVKQLNEAKALLKHKGRLPNEDDTDYKMRKYKIGNVYQQIVDNYDAALAAFTDNNIDSTSASDGRGGTIEEINVAIIGRPNVGKSSLINAIFGETRAIVSDIAGTTRDSIDAVVERPPSSTNNATTLYRFVDTAGIRRKGKIEFGSEFFMVNRALRAIRRADVVLLILDATAGVMEQDRILAQKISDDGRACVVLCNKWDAVVDKDSTTYEKSIKYVRNELPQIRWAPILFVSAATGQRITKLYPTIDGAVQAHRKRISTAVANEILRDAILYQPPPVKRSGAQAKIYYCHQVSTRPPTMVVFCNDPSLVSDNYRRYMDRRFRESIDGFEASPIRWIYRGRREREMLMNNGRKNMNGNPGDGGTGSSNPFPHAG